MEPKSSLQFLQKLADCPSLEPDQSSLRTPHRFPKDTFQYYPPIYVYVFQVVPFPLVSPVKHGMHLSSPHTCHLLRPSHSS